MQTTNNIRVSLGFNPSVATSTGLYIISQGNEIILLTEQPAPDQNTHQTVKLELDIGYNYICITVPHNQGLSDERTIEIREEVGKELGNKVAALRRKGKLPGPRNMIPMGKDSTPGRDLHTKLEHDPNHKEDPTYFHIHETFKNNITNEQVILLLESLDTKMFPQDKINQAVKLIRQSKITKTTPPNLELLNTIELFTLRLLMRKNKATFGFSKEQQQLIQRILSQPHHCLYRVHGSSKKPDLDGRMLRVIGVGSNQQNAVVRNVKHPKRKYKINWKLLTPVPNAEAMELLTAIAIAAQTAKAAATAAAAAEAEAEAAAADTTSNTTCNTCIAM